MVSLGKYVQRFVFKVGRVEMHYSNTPTVTGPHRGWENIKGTLGFELNPVTSDASVDLGSSLFTVCGSCTVLTHSQRNARKAAREAADIGKNAGRLRRRAIGYTSDEGGIHRRLVAMGHRSQAFGHRGQVICQV